MATITIAKTVTITMTIKNHDDNNNDNDNDNNNNHPKPNIAKLSQTSKHFQMLQNSLKRSGNLTKAPKTSKCFGEFQSIWESFGAFRLMWK